MTLYSNVNWCWSSNRHHLQLAKNWQHRICKISPLNSWQMWHVPIQINLKLKPVTELPVMRKFLKNVEWKKHRVVKCVYGSLLWFTTSMSYDNTASTFSPVRKQIPVSLFSAMDPDINKSIQKSIHIEMLWLLWCLSDSCGHMWGASVFLQRLHATPVTFAVCRTDAGREGSRQQTCSRSAV